MPHGSLFVFTQRAARFATFLASRQMESQGRILSGSFAFVKRSLLILVPATLFACGFAGAQTAISIGERANVVSGLANTPTDLGVDSSGNVYVLDASAGTVVKYPAGNASPATTVLSGLTSPAGMAVTASGGVCVANTGANVVTCGGSLSASITAGFSAPTDVAIDSSGNIYVADSGTNSILRATPGSAPSVLISGISANSIAVNSRNDVFVTDATSARWYQSSSSYTAPTIVATLTRTSTLAIGADDSLYLEDNGAKAVSKFSLASSYATGSIVAVAGSAPGNAVDAAGNVYTAGGSTVQETFLTTQRFADAKVGAVSAANKTYVFYFTGSGFIAAPRVTLGGNPSLDFADVGTGTCTSNGSSHAYAVGDSCTVDVRFTAGAVGLRRGAIELLDACSTVSATVYLAGVGVGSQPSFTPATATTVFASSSLDTSSGQFDGFGNLYYTSYVSGTNASNIFKLTPGGTIGSVVSYTSPNGMVIDGAGNLFYVGLSGTVKHLFKLAFNTTVTPVDLGAVASDSIGMAIDRTGNLYVFANNAINRLAVGTYAPTVLANYTSTSVVGMTMDANDNLFFVDGATNHLKVIYANTTAVVDLSGANISSPYGIAVDPAGNVYVGNSNSVTARFAAGTYASSVASTGDWAEWLTFASNGDLYSGAYGKGVRKLALTSAPALTLPTTAMGSTSAATSLTVTNAGNANLNITVPNSGSNPALTSPFLLANSTTCPWLSSTSPQTALASGALCNYNVQFAPTLAQTYNGSLTLSYLDALNTPASTAVTLTGIGYDGNFLGATLSHTGSGTQGGTLSYITSLTNSSPNATSGTISLQIGLPTGFSLVSASGTNWTCSVSTATCTTSTAIAGNSASNPLTFTVAISFVATSSPVTVSATGGGATNTASASDPTTVVTSPVYRVDSIADTAGDCSTGHTAGSCTLRTALATANADASTIVGVDFDSIVFASPQTITLQSSLPAMTRSLVIAGPGQANLTIHGADLYSVLSGTILTVSDLTLAHGYRAGNGGCVSTSGTLTLRTVTVQYCKANDAASPGTTISGGGVYSAGLPTISRSIISNNSLSGTGLLRGGGIYAGATLTMDNSTVSNNTVTAGAGLSGAGLFTANATISDSVISGNAGTSTGTSGDVIAGGLYVNGTTALTRVRITGNSITGGANATGGGLYAGTATNLTSSTVSQNTATATGTGIASGGGINTAGVTFRNNVIAGNTASSATGPARGGGMATATTGTLTLTGTMVDGNRATSGTAGSGFGGGMYLSGATVTSDATGTAFNIISNNFVTGNGGGIWAANSATGSYTFRGFVIANNTASGSNFSGGGLYLSGRSNTLGYLSIYGNSSDAKGAGLATITGTITTFQLLNSNISGNTAQTSGAGGMSLAATSGVTTLTNNTVTGNVQTGTSDVSILRVPSGNSNILQGCVGNCTTISTVTAPTLLGPLAYNGGATKTLLPQTGSNVIGLGASCTTLDLRGYTRATGCDIGAVNSTGTGAAPLTITVPAVTITLGTSANLSASVAYTGTAPSTGFFFRVGTGIANLGTCTGTSSPLTCTATVDTSALPTGTYAITAYQTGSTSVSGGEGSGSLYVGTAAPTTTPTVTADAKSINYGAASTTLTASVAYAGSIAPTGQFTFQVDSGTTVTATCTGSASPLTCSAAYNTSTLTVDTHSISAALASDINFNSVSNTANLAVSATAPGAPTIGTATAGNGQATVAFTAPTATGGAAITGYTVTSSPGNITATGSASPITVTGLTNGTAYTFTVTGTNTAGPGTASAASNSVTPAGAPVASSFTYGSVVAYNASTTTATSLSLSAYATNSPTAYAVGSATTAQGGYVSVDNTGAASYTPPAGFHGNDSFTFTASNTAGTSSPATVTVTVGNPTLTATLPTATATVGTAYNSSAAAIVFNGGKAPYIVNSAAGLPAGLSLSGGVISGTPTATCTCTIALNVTDSSTPYGYTATINTSLPVSAGVPAIPTGVSASAGDAQAVVSFSAPAENGAAITGYTVTSSPGGVMSTGSASPITVTGLVNGTSYTFAVTAMNSVGTGLASGASGAVTPMGAQTITFANPGAQNFGTTPTLTAAATSGLAVTFTSPTPSVCTITSGGALTFIAAGTCTINADQAGNTAYNAATQVGRSFTVNAVVPGVPAIGAATAGNAQATVSFTAPASIGGATITGYTVTSSPGGITATGSASPITVTGLTNGTAYAFTVTASNTAGAGSSSAASNAVTPIGTQTIAFANPGAQNFGTTPTLAATADSGLAVRFTSATPAVCTVTTGGTLTFASTGTCTVNADQAGNTAYSAATQVTHSFLVNAVAPGAPTTGSATAGNGQATVSFSAPATTGGAAITGYTVTSSPSGITAAGSASPITVTGLTNGTAYTFTVTASNTAGAGSASAPSNSVTPQGTQTITFANPGAQTFATSPTLTATSSSGLSVTFTSSSAGICTVTPNGTLTFVATGMCSVSADQAGNSAYTAAATVSRSFTVQAASQTITFANPGPQTFGTSPTLTGTSTSGLPVAFSSTTPAVCTVTGAGSLTFLSGGTCSISADQSGNNNYSAAATVTRGFTVNAVAPGVPTGVSASGGDAQASVSFIAPASGGGSAITGYTVTSLPGDITATGTASLIVVTGLINGTSYTFTVKATNTAGSSVASVSSNSAIPTGTQTITFPALSSQTFGMNPTVSATASSGLAVTFTSNTAGVCTVTSVGTLTFVATGTCTVQADQAGSAAYNAATSVSRSFAVQPAAQTITFAVNSPVSYGVNPIALSATGGASGNQIAFSVISGPGSISGSTLTVQGAGNIVVAADQAGSTNYAAGTQVQRTLVVNKSSQTLTFNGPSSPVTYGTSPVSLTATPGASTAPVVFSVISGPATINGSTLTITGAGSIVIAADQAGDTNYAAATQVQRTLAVTKSSQTLTFTGPTSPITYGAAPIALSATAGASTAPVVFSIISGPATINGSTLTITGAGSIIIAADQAGDTNYAAATQIQRTLTVITATPQIAWSAPADVVYGTPLSSLQLNATATGIQSQPINGTFAYSPAAGTLLSAGSGQSLSVVFTPTDNANYAPASGSVVINVTTGAQSISFTQPTSPIVYGSATTVPLTAVGGGSGNAVMFSATGPAAIAGSTLTITGAGTITITANQSGNSNYVSASPVARTLIVSKAMPTLSGPASPVVTAYQQAAAVTFNIVAPFSGAGITAPSGAVNYTITDATLATSASGSLTLSSGLVSVPVPATVAAGSYTVNATYAGDANYASAAATATVSVGQLQPVITWPQPASIAYGNTLGAVLNASAQYNSVAVPGTFTYFNASSPVTATTTLPAGSYTLSVVFQPNDLVNYKAANSSATLVVTKAVAAVALTTSKAVVFAQNAVTLTASVTGSGTTPTGSVIFYDGTPATVIGTGTMTNGVASISVSALAVGAHTIGATYSGDSNFANASSATLSQTVQDLTFDFVISNGSSSAGSGTTRSILPGGSATFDFNVVPSGPNFPADITVTVSGLPAGFTATVTPPVIVAGSGVTAVKLVVTAPTTMGKLELVTGAGPVTLALLLLPFSGRMRRIGRRLLAVAALSIFFLLPVVALTGCGGGNFSQKQQAVTFTVTATSGSLSRSTTLTLNVL